MLIVNNVCVFRAVRCVVVGVKFCVEGGNLLKTVSKIVEFRLCNSLNLKLCYFFLT